LKKTYCIDYARKIIILCDSWRYNMVVVFSDQWIIQNSNKFQIFILESNLLIFITNFEYSIKIYFKILKYEYPKIISIMQFEELFTVTSTIYPSHNDGYYDDDDLFFMH